MTQMEVGKRVKPEDVVVGNCVWAWTRDGERLGRFECYRDFSDTLRLDEDWTLFDDRLILAVAPEQPECPPPPEQPKWRPPPGVLCIVRTPDGDVGVAQQVDGRWQFTWQGDANFTYRDTMSDTVDCYPLPTPWEGDQDSPPKSNSKSWRPKPGQMFAWRDTESEQFGVGRIHDDGERAAIIDNRGKQYMSIAHLIDNRIEFFQMPWDAEPVEPQPKTRYDWDKAPEWAFWAATDESGEVGFFAEQPIPGRSSWVQWNGQYAPWDHEARIPDSDWRESLQQRPRTEAT